MNLDIMKLDEVRRVLNEAKRLYNEGFDPEDIFQYRPGTGYWY